MFLIYLKQYFIILCCNIVIFVYNKINICKKKLFSKGAKAQTKNSTRLLPHKEGITRIKMKRNTTESGNSLINLEGKEERHPIFSKRVRSGIGFPEDMLDKNLGEATEDRFNFLNQRSINIRSKDP